MILVRSAVVRWSLLGATMFLSACAHDMAAPIALGAYPAALAGRTLDDKAPDAIWTASDLLAASLQRNATIAEAAARYRTAIAAAKATRVRSGMSLTLTAEYSKDASGSAPWLYGAGSDIPLDRGERRGARLDAADLAAVQALYDYGEAVWAVRTALARSSGERRSAEAELTLAQRLEALRQARAERLDQRVAAGEDDRATALAARTDLAVAHRRTADAVGRRARADAALAQALGVPIEAVLKLRLAPPTSAPATFNLAQARQNAALTRRDVLRAVVDYDLAENALKLEIARQYPELRVGPGYSWDHGVSKLPFTLGLALPPLDLNRAAIAQAEARRSEAGRALEASQAVVLAAVDQAQAVLDAAQTNEILTRDRDLAVARRLAETMARSVKAGQADRVDELGVQANVLEAELALLDARRAALSAGVDLEDALRAPFDPDENRLLQNATRRLGAGS